MSIRTFLIRASIAALAAVAAGCETPQPRTAAQAELDRLTKLENLPGKPACFWKSNFDGDWTVLNDSTLIVRAPLPKDAYVIKLFQPVFDLSFKQALGFEDKEHTGRICNDTADSLRVPGWQPPQVLIVAVHALTLAEENQLLKAAGKPARHLHSATQPPSPKE